jgi:hypothetical protein
MAPLVGIAGSHNALPMGITIAAAETAALLCYGFLVKGLKRRPRPAFEVNEGKKHLKLLMIIFQRDNFFRGNDFGFILVCYQGNSWI